MLANRLPIVIEYIIIVAAIVVSALSVAFYCSNLYFGN